MSRGLALLSRSLNSLALRVERAALRAGSRGDLGGHADLDHDSGHGRWADGKANGTSETAGVDGYGARWSPPDTTQAMELIYCTASTDSFEEGGRQDAERVGRYLTPGAVALDLGCGMGRVARYVSEQCAQVWAVDASPRMLDLAAEYLADRANVRFARCYDTSFPEVPDASVDLAYSILVLQHMEREDAFCLLKELLRVLRPGGTAYLTYPNLLSDAYLTSFLDYVDNGEVTNPIRARMYTPQEVERLVPAAGFTVTKVEPGTEIVVVAQRPATE